jgi:hypothetical protein
LMPELNLPWRTRYSSDSRTPINASDAGVRTIAALIAIAARRGAPLRRRAGGRSPLAEVVVRGHRQLWRTQVAIHRSEAQSSGQMCQNLWADGRSDDRHIS